jgi:hypothetical protein
MNTPDHVELYARSAGLKISARTVFVEGTSDVEYFKIASQLEEKSGGSQLLGGSFSIVAAGERGRGGVDGLVQQLLVFRAMASTYRDKSGRQVYRFLGLFDNDHAGRSALKLATSRNVGLQEFSDVFNLFPVMNPAVGDPAAVGRAMLKANDGFKGIDWEIEDMLCPSFLDEYERTYSRFLKSKKTSPGGHVHREWTPDGKTELLRFTRRNAMRQDVDRIVAALVGLRSYIGAK